MSDTTALMDTARAFGVRIAHGGYMTDDRSGDVFFAELATLVQRLAVLSESGAVIVTAATLRHIETMPLPIPGSPADASNAARRAIIAAIKEATDGQG